MFSLPVFLCGALNGHGQEDGGEDRGWGTFGDGDVIICHQLQNTVNSAVCKAQMLFLLGCVAFSSCPRVHGQLKSVLRLVSLQRLAHKTS